MPSEWLLPVIALLTVLAAARSWRLRRTQRALAQDMIYASLRYEDAAHAGESLARLATAQRLAEIMVAGGATTVQAVHKSIASIPFGLLEAIPVTRAPTKIVRGVHDLTANSVYRSIRGINRVLGKQIRKGLGESEKKDDEPEKDGD